MSRKENTNVYGGSFTRAEIDAVWAKAMNAPALGGVSKDAKWDAYMGVIKYSEYGNRNSEHGWEIDHIKPVAAGGKDNIENLQPLNWKTNVAKSDHYPWTPNYLKWKEVPPIRLDGLLKKC
jgi:hypothetical protein